MQRIFTWPRLLVVALGSLTLTHAAAGEQGGAERARSLLTELLSRGAEARIAKEPINRARSTLERADAARQENNQNKAHLLDDFALEWASTARELIEAEKLERQATTLEQQVATSETKLRRARALLEETEMRRGRARTELIRLEPESASEFASPTATGSPAGSPRPAPAGTSADAQESPQ